ncbi:MAG: PQQ-like beta-propeller repeat protein [Phycisphaerales bacterium]|nr:PQQ-like beta-propeller repeat protein [Phycisphaerales bacterium]
MTKVEPDHRRLCRVRRAALLAAGAASVLLGGCVFETAPASTRPSSASPGSAAQARAMIDARQAAFKIDHDGWAGLGYRLDWRGFPVVAKGQHITFLNVYDDLIVAQESAATVSVLEASTGALRNSSQVASPLTRFEGNFRDGNRLVVSSDTEVFIVDLQTGGVVERHPLSRVVSTRPVFFGGEKIYGTAIGHIYSHMMNPPVDAWAFDLGAPIDAAPVLLGSEVVAVSRRGDIAMLDASSGTLVGRASIFGSCQADPVAGDGAVFFASMDQSIYSFDGAGRPQWRIRTEHPLRITPTYAAGVLYVPTSDKGLRALDAATGAELWSQKDVSGRVVAIRAGHLITWDGAVASSLDAATGEVLASLALPEVQILQPDRFEDGNLYAVSKGGVIAKFQTRD